MYVALTKVKQAWLKDVRQLRSKARVFKENQFLVSFISTKKILDYFDGQSGCYRKFRELCQILYARRHPPYLIFGINILRLKLGIGISKIHVSFLFCGFINVKCSTGFQICPFELLRQTRRHMQTEISMHCAKCKSLESGLWSPESALCTLHWTGTNCFSKTGGPSRDELLHEEILSLAILTSLFYFIHSLTLFVLSLVKIG